MCDITQLLKNTNKDCLKITLKNDHIKGIGVYAVQPIKKNELIAYYKIKVFDASNYQSPMNFAYTFSVFTRSGLPNDALIGDIDMESFPSPIDNVPFWGPFVNEPSDQQMVNAAFNPNIKYNYKSHKRCGFKRGDTLIYSVYALKDVDVGQEIVVYYGDEYDRDYQVDVSKIDRHNLDYKDQKPVRFKRGGSSKYIKSKNSFSCLIR